MTLEVKNAFYNFKYIDIKYDDSNIEKEICRENEFIKIKKKFAELLEYFDAKPKKDDITTNSDKILVRFIFNNYSTRFKLAKDGIFHYTKKKDESIASDITYVFSNISLKDAKAIVGKLNIIKMFKDAIVKIKKLKQTAKKYYTKTHNNNSVLFKGFNLEYDFTIPKTIYNRLQERYNQYKSKNNHSYILDDLIFILLLRYNTLNSGGHQWGMPLIIKDKFKKEVNINFECFASSLNHYYYYYCSMFYDVEKYFMSLGPFQNITYIYGNYMANPPYELSLLNTIVSTFTKALSASKKSGNKLAFTYGMPDWSDFDMIEFLDNSEKSEFYKGKVILEPYKYVWHDFIDFSASRKIPQSILYVLGNYNISFKLIKGIMNDWKKL